MVIDVTDKDFKQEVIDSNLPTVVDIWAPWCGPCRMIGPIVDKLSEEYEGRVKFCKLNVDNSRETAISYGVQSIPLLLFFKNGEKVDESLGALPEEMIRPKVEALL